MNAEPLQSLHKLDLNANDPIENYDQRTYESVQIFV
jgi:hypothetical protein